VIAVGRDEAGGTEYCESLRGAGLSVDFMCGDVTDSGSLASVAHEIGKLNLHVDIVVNNVGGLFNAAGGVRGWVGIPDEDWFGTFSKTVISAVAVSRLFVPQMKQTGWGRVINIGSIAACEPPSS